MAGAQKKVDGWLRARHMGDLFAVKVREQDGLPKVNCTSNRGRKAATAGAAAPGPGDDYE